eukprot:Protomagalhaensia_wolfi_Nauph_80__668@NODE_1381_length_1555_cov_975_598285_g1067_i0_p1_GENE_NODE_1381_length_1555_cov_975_598285_g1067_i0NODE_1381_length_1555_cov_975_598285_g1067_i0_p1_ORF_typecomplete_len407_score91_31S1P1_nuclease/PF02265_16/8_2e28_NODE_1381_length_1555_cov_975_598285_g1067_i0601280
MKSLAALVLVAGVSGWWDEGHQLLCRVALNYLEDEQRTDVIDLVEATSSLYPDEWPGYNNFETGCTWLDAVRNAQQTAPYLPLWAGFHFVNLPAQSVKYDKDDPGTHPPGVDVDGPGPLSGYWIKYLDQTGLMDYINNSTRLDIIWAVRALKDSMFPTGGINEDRIYLLEHAINLRALSHLIGDSHMPLHSCGLWNDVEHCSGGNAFPVDYSELVDTVVPEGQSSNLHGFWDSLCFWAPNLDKTPENIHPKARQLMVDFPYNTYIENGVQLELTDHDASPINVDSYATCMGYGLGPDDRYIYKDNGDSATTILNWDRPTQRPDDAYIAWCQHTGRDLLTRGGYRLAHELIHWFNSVPDSIKERIFAAAEGGNGGGNGGEGGNGSGAPSNMLAGGFVIMLYTMLSSY